MKKLNKENSSIESKPIVSIITVVYNGDKTLEKTIQSVINQSYESIEYIIIDGGSTDGTVDIIKKYEENIAYWISEKDDGIYDAMNKGLSVSTGDVIGILNADDYYRLDSVEVSIKALLESSMDYAVGKVNSIPSNIITSPIFPLTKTIYQGMMYPHIGAFIKREIYQKVGFFDTTYKISADFDLAMRIHLAGFRAVEVNSVIGDVLEGGVSAGNNTKIENMVISIKYGQNPFIAKYLYYKLSLKATIKSLVPLGILRWIKN